jgi:Tfp pilus assembly protein PilO
MRGFAESLSMLRYSMRSKAARHAVFAMLTAAIACLAIALVWWGPAKREQIKLVENIDAKRTAMVETARTTQVARAQREALTAVALLEKKLEVRAGQAEIIQGIARLASKSGVRVTSQSFDEGRVQRGDAQLYLELGLSGDYVSLRRLMGGLAVLPMWIEVVEARLERAEAGGAQVRAQLRLLTYRNAKEQP